MNTDKLIIIRYGELGIKSPRVRRRFEKKLISNIKNVVEGNISYKEGRLFLNPEDYDNALEKLKKIPGIVSFSPVIETQTNHNSIEIAVKNYIDNLISKEIFSPDKSFAVRCKRVGSHEFTSQELAGFCGSVIVNNIGAPVNLSNPDFELFIEVRNDKTYIFHEKIIGIGGLPLGTQGRVISLVSGGIDSPVATFLMMKRGCDVSILHFNNHPYTSGSNEKVLKIARKLKEYSSGSKLKFYQVNYGEYLHKCIEDAPERMTCVLCKSGMYQIAEKLAEEEKALAIVDGSSIGQVASQTLPNILATRYSTSLPILSPLIGLDKLEIEAIARKIGTMDISIQPDSGCSAVPRYPETNTDLQKLLEVQDDIEIEKLLNNVISSIQEIKL
ncbi:MAG: tRNA 4-thiouridine(8) synthase ThiI [Methanobacteriaceae archaeon]